MIIQHSYNDSGCDLLWKIVLTSCEAMQAISLLVILFLLHPKTKGVFKEIGKKISSNSSDASLEPSANSRSTTIVHEDNQTVNTWNEFVAKARNSISDGNLYTIEPRISISTSPDPTKMVRSGTYHHSLDPRRRNTIRDIMARAKHNAPKPLSEYSFTTNIIQPLPKNIPNQILDDVRLFDFYYNNLNSIFIDENPQTTAFKKICTDRKAPLSI